MEFGCYFHYTLSLIRNRSCNDEEISKTYLSRFVTVIVVSCI
jgi:hypothetical protein